MHEQATKPGAARGGLSNSPAGLAAWISQRRSSRGAALAQMAAQHLIASCCCATLTLYWTTETIVTSPAALLGSSPPRRRQVHCRWRCVAGFRQQSASSAANKSRFPNRLKSSRSAATTSPLGLNTTSADTFPRSPSGELLAQSLRDAFRPMRCATQSRGATRLAAVEIGAIEIRRDRPPRAL